MNYKQQFYKSVPLTLIEQCYDNTKAKEFSINSTKRTLWIPNKHLEEDGTIKRRQNLDYVLRKNEDACFDANIDLSKYL